MKNNVIIEPMTINDLENISSCLKNDFDDFWNYNILKSELQNPNSFYIVCKLDSKVIGFAGITIILDIAELNNIVIKKTHRGKGISSLLLTELIQFSKKNHCKQINLEVAENNEIAINLYTKFNFKQVGRRKNYYQTQDAILLTKNL